jgi:hypothetical protein
MYRGLYLAIIIDLNIEPYEAIITDMYRGLCLAIIMGWNGEPY